MMMRKKAVTMNTESSTQQSRLALGGAKGEGTQGMKMLKMK
jgi:hypothetical protein